jgi:PIN domain nuclease of toxin-antitoxin system
MRILIDTQIFIWAVLDSKYLGEQARSLMIDADEIFVSAASIWEISIKTKLGKLEGEPEQFVKAITKSGFQELAISVRHAVKVYNLPNYHRDPFDRMLIAQALSEPLLLLTADQTLGQYGDFVITTSKNV